MQESESDFQGWIVDTAKRFGWRVWHAPTPMRPVGGGKFVPDKRGAGLPDLFMLHDDPPRMILAEVKGPGGVLSDAQREFLSLARAVARVVREGQTGAVVGAYVWRPEHRELIEATLRSKVIVS